MRRLALFLVMLTCVSSASAQAGGSDMWTQLFEKNGLFSPHTDYCTTNEVFISVGGGDLGFCIEKADRVAAQFEDARQDCAANGKRLPEPAEWKFACDAAPTGLVDMNDSYEWASNFPVPLLFSTTNLGIAVPTAGYTTCSHLNWSWIGNIVATTASLEYRCVR